MNAYQSIFKNSIFSILAQIIYRGANAYLFFLIANKFGTTDAGIYTLGLTYFVICSRLSFFGLDHLLIREVSKQPHLVEGYYTTFAFVRILTSSILIVSVALFLVLGSPYEWNSTRIILIMLAGVIPENLINLNLGCFTAREEVYWSSLTFTIHGLVKLLASVLIVLNDYPLIWIAWTFLISQLIAFLVSSGIVFTRYISKHPLPSLNLIKTTARTSSAFFVISAFYVLDNRFDNLILSWFRGETELGIYSYAFNIVSIFLIIPSGFRTALLPVLSKQNLLASCTSFKRLYTNSYRYLLWMGLPISVALILLANPILSFLYDNFTPATELALQLMGVTLFGMFINVLNTRFLIVKEMQGIVALSLIISMVINIITNLWLIPKWGAVGTAVARSISFLTLFTINSLFVLPYFKQLALWRLYVPTATASIILGGFILSAQPHVSSIIFLSILGFFVFCLSLIISSIVLPEERLAINNLLKKQYSRLISRSQK